MKYNRALDLLAGAAEYGSKGKVNAAAKLFNAALNDPSLKAALAIVEASNFRGYHEVVASSRTLRIKAADIDSKPKSGVADQNPGAELKVQPEENGDRVVQEADFDDLDDLDGDEIESAASEDDEEDTLDDEDEVKSATVSASAKKVKTTANSDFARALKNMNVLSRK